jgi:PAS domain S-box-containing protein
MISDPKHRCSPSVQSPEELKQSPEMYRLLVECAADHGIFMLDPSGRILSWNTGAERLKGYTGAEVVGQHISMLYTPEDQQRRHPDRELEVAAREGRYEEEGWRMRKDGSRFWANVVITAIRTDRGTLLGYGKVIRDNSHRRTLMLELEASKERYKSLFEHNPDPVYALDRQGRFVQANAPAAKITGYAVQDLQGTHFSALVVPECLDRTLRAFHAALADEPQHFETIITHRRGYRIDLGVTLVPTFIGGEIVGAFGIAEDISGEKRIEEERARLLKREQRARAEAEAASQAKSVFLASMSHELRTPINAITGYTELLAMELSGPVTERQQEQLARIRDSGKHLLGLVNDVLDLSKIEAGEIETASEEVKATNTVQAALDLVRPLLGKGQLTVTERCEGKLEAVYVGDEDRVRQILVNLLSNAAKFTEPEGQLAVICGMTDAPDADLQSSHPGPWAYIRVEDTGIGIPEGQIETVFEPFVQADSGLTRKQGGTGLGLPISRRLARLMGGDLVAESRVGQGSTFTLWLPAPERRGYGRGDPPVDE